ncbi:MAG: UDP-glucose/GDP-mannose dehydrogenase family protein [Bdellovibrionota bacterium]
MANTDYIIDEIAVIGAGYVGLVSGACFASFGFQVSMVEVNAAKIESLQKGQVPIYEPGLEPLLQDALHLKTIAFFHSSKDLFAQRSPEVVFIAVGTPENPDGSCNLDYVFQAVRDVVGAMKKDVVLVLKSTVPVGTAQRVKALIRELNPSFRVGVVNNPEFLKEGSAVADFMRPERVVLGGSDMWAVDRVKALYHSLLHNGSPLFVTDHETAELGKLSANLMLASRISLINQVSRLAQAYGADVRQVESILRSDSRIGSKYLYAGLGYGGSCFPKDVKDFIHLCKEKGVDASMAQAVDDFNDSQKLFFIDDIRKSFPNAKSTTIALLGVAFKPETDDIRESPALVLTEELRKLGYNVRAYDPKAIQNYQQWMTSKNIQGVECFPSAKTLLEGADVAVLVTEWQEFQRLALGGLVRLFKGKKLYDGKNVFTPSQVRGMGFEYMGVGRS